MKSSDPIDIVVLAGGLGKRLRSVVSDVPKPMAPVLGKPFMEHKILNLIQLNNVRKIILSIAYKANIIQDYFGSSIMGKPIEYVVEDTPAGTGGAIKEVLFSNDDVTDYVVIVNGDTWCPFTVTKSIEKMQLNNSTAVINVTYLENNNRYGSVYFNSSGLITKFGPFTNLSGYINTGNYLVDVMRTKNELITFPKIFSFESDYLEPKVNENNFSAVVSQSMFLDIGVPEDYLKAKDVLSG